MRKGKTAALVLCALIAVSAGGCAGQKPENAVSAAAEAEETVDVSFTAVSYTHLGSGDWY